MIVLSMYLCTFTASFLFMLPLHFLSYVLRDHPFKTSANFHDFWPLPRKNILRIGYFEKLSFFESAILDFFSSKNKHFASSPRKLVKVSWVSRMGRNFDDYPSFQPKIIHPKHFSRQNKMFHMHYFSISVTSITWYSKLATEMQKIVHWDILL